MDDIFRLDSTARRDPRIAAWFAIADPHRTIAQSWFEHIRGLGPDVREVLHDGCPVACVGNAAFAYVDAYKSYASVGFYFGASLDDPAHLLEGDGKRMRHVKLRPGKELDDKAVCHLIAAAYHDARQRLGLIRAPHGERATMVREKAKRTKSKSKENKSAPVRIDKKIERTGDWRAGILSCLRKLIHEADPQATETVKWRKASNPLGVPVWEHDGILCTGETYNDKVKVTFARGAALADPAKQFNSSLEGNMRRAIDFGEGAKINAKAFKALVRAAAALNASKAKRP
jgi:hypothetical protein